MIRLFPAQLVAAAAIFVFMLPGPAEILSGRRLLAAQKASSTDRLDQQRQELLDRFQRGVARLMEKCRDSGQTDAVRELSRWATPVSAEVLASQLLPVPVQPSLAVEAGDPDRSWQVELRHLRQETAQQLYLLSRRALPGGSPALAWQLIREVLWYDSDHERCRTLLGFERSGDEWMSPFAASRRRNGYVDHPLFGWILQTHAERYERGERYYRGQWMTAQREAEIRRDFEAGWLVESDRYLIKTNISQEAGVEVARRLEAFNSFFRQACPAFFNSPEQLQQLMADPRKNARRRTPHNVYVYRDREEYVARLKRTNPQIEITNGIYIPDDRVAHFFDRQDSDLESTLYHEATHQILYELHPRSRPIAESEHFWVVEGLACYMESFRVSSDGSSIGNPAHIRVQNARSRLVDSNFFIPLAELSALGKTAFQRHPSIEPAYSQSAGLVHFFMHYNGGLYRDALIRHVAALYAPSTGAGRVAGLDRLTGVSYTELDRQYRDYIGAIEPVE